MRVTRLLTAAVFTLFAAACSTDSPVGVETDATQYDAAVSTMFSQLSNVEASKNNLGVCKMWGGNGPVPTEPFEFTWEATTEPSSGSFSLMANTCAWLGEGDNMHSWSSETLLTVTEDVPAGMKVSEVLLGDRSTNGATATTLTDPGASVQVKIGKVSGMIFVNVDTPPPPPVPTGICEGGVTKLVVKYIGAAPLNGEVRGKRRNPKPSAILPGQVSIVNGETHYTFAMTTLGGLFSPVANGRIGNNFQLYIGNTQIVDFHTSCSAPIYPGMQLAGTFEIVEVYSAKGGQIGPQ